MKLRARSNRLLRDLLDLAHPQAGHGPAFRTIVIGLGYQPSDAPPLLTLEASDRRSNPLLLLTPVSKLTQETPRETIRKVWLWPNISSLDAPIVAILWEMLFAASSRQRVFSLSTIVLGLTVWLIYVSDRILDGFCNNGNGKSERHAFHHSNRTAFLLFGSIVFAIITFFLQFLPGSLLENGFILAALVGLYFLFIHIVPLSIRKEIPKEALVGILFSAGTCLAPWTGSPHLTQFEVAAALFGVLCTLNCSAIELWEWELRSGGVHDRPNTLALWAGTHVKILSGALGAVSVCLFLQGEMHLVFGALTLSALAFLWLATERHRFSPAGLRVFTDAPLLSPLVLFGLHLLAKSGF